ncbi:hypothetical protein Peur_004589 [Populus x canadensis]
METCYEGSPCLLGSPGWPAVRMLLFAAWFADPRPWLLDVGHCLGLVWVEVFHLLVGISQVETVSPFACSCLVDGSWCRCVGHATVCLFWGSIQVRLSPQCFDLPVPGCAVLVALECWKPCLFWALLFGLPYGFDA